MLKNLKRSVAPAVALAAVLAIGMASSAMAGPRVLMVMRSEVPGGSSDPAVLAHLRQEGFDVTTTEGLSAMPSTCGFDLVILSSTVRSNQFTADRAAIDRLRDMKQPLLTWENDLQDDLRFTGLHRDVQFGEVETGHYGWMVRAPHPMSAGLPSGAIVWTAARQPAGWGTPGLGADIIMTRPGEPEKAMLYAYETGATMDGTFDAPARRVFIGMDNGSFDNLTPEGHKLFDAAVN
jgi:hypothetical protein